MNIIIAETAIDLVPDDWLTNPKIKKYYKKNKRKPIIDGSIHQHLLKSIPLENHYLLYLIVQYYIPFFFSIV